LWQSPAWPEGSGQPDYINACAQVETQLNARELLGLLHKIEAKFGRKRGVGNAARTLDLDLLDYHGEQIAADDITIPHPRMLARAFVLFPLQEIAPQWRDPIESRRIDDWIARLPLADVAPLKRLHD
jgi:2-amino-4-hydroxy-6-hydroxymethyldihydropteridine diphosphokinase